MGERKIVVTHVVDCTLRRLSAGVFYFRNLGGTANDSSHDNILLSWDFLFDRNFCQIKNAPLWFLYVRCKNHGSRIKK